LHTRARAHPPNTTAVDTNKQLAEALGQISPGLGSVFEASTDKVNRALSGAAGASSSAVDAYFARSSARKVCGALTAAPAAACAWSCGAHQMHH
jgi:hypothetical protein